MNFTLQLFWDTFYPIFCFGTTLFFFADETFIIALTYNFVLQYYVCCWKLIIHIMLDNNRIIASTQRYITFYCISIWTHARNVLQLLMQFYLLYLTMLPCNSCNCKIQKCRLEIYVFRVYTNDIPLKNINGEHGNILLMLVTMFWQIP